MINNVYLLRQILSARQRLALVAILIGLLLAAALESLGIGLILPFLRLITDPNVFQTMPWLAELFAISGAASRNDFLIYTSVTLVFVFILKNVYLALVSYIHIRFSQGIFQQIALRLLRAYCARPYTFHLVHNSAEIVRVITSDAHAISNALLRPGLTLVTELLVVVAVTSMLAIIDPLMTILAFSTIGGAAGIFYFWIRPGLHRLGETAQSGSGGMIHWINQSLGAIREIKVSGRGEFFFSSFDENVKSYVHSTTVSQVLQILPRLILESFAIVGLAGAFILSIWQGRSDDQFLPVLATFAVAAFRLMPSANRIIIAAGQVHLGGPFLNAVARGLENEMPATQFQPTDKPSRDMRKFERSIELSQISFSYADTSIKALHKISFVVGRGESVGIVGPSGAGKSTLLNVILGLLTPTDGEFRIDGRSVLDDPTAWQRRTGFVPQDIYLMDDTIRANIAFGLTEHEVDDARVSRAIEAARLSETIKGFDRGLDTIVGERGIRLSGGQKQRVAIARALYHDPDVIIMDEATAALDRESEREIANTITRLRGQRTLIVVAHRFSTVKECDRLIFLKGGRIVAIGTYDDLAQSNFEFRQMAQILR